MSAVDPSSPVDEVASSAARRKSGRVSKKPDRFAPVASPNGSTKRKRGDDNDSGVDADEPPSEDESEQSSEGEPDEEELRERRRKKKSKAPARKPAPKKAKTNGETVNLAIRPANAAKKIAKRPRKAPVRKSALPADVGGLYGRHRKHGGTLHELTHYSRRVRYWRATTGRHSTLGRAFQRE
jgi:cohesin complex subunit SA-1/2